MSTDVRAELFNGLAKEAADAAAKKRREEFMADLRARGIIKTKTKEEDEADEKRAVEQARIEAEEGFPWLIVGGLILGVIAVFGLVGGLIVWLVMTFTEN
jgi:farnesyl-diphosphate farnesyltransferase